MAINHPRVFPEILSSHLPKGVAFHRSHFWIDYLELLCLAHVDGQISQSEISAHLRRLKELSKDEDITDEIEDLIEIDEVDEGHEGDVGTPEVNMIEPEIDDKWQKRVEDWFSQVSNRKNLCQEYYPFSIVSGGTVLKLSKLYPKKKLYIMLLMCSALEYVQEYNRRHCHTLDLCFELISYEALKNYMPKHAIIRYFGKSKYNTTIYRNGTLWAKLNRLAIELNDHVKAGEQEYSPTNTGDEGIDLVAWIPFKDQESAFLSLFGQCTCRHDWLGKQDEVDYSRLRSLFELSAKNSNALFVPFFLRDSNGSFLEKRNIRSVLFDRPRILHYLNDVSFQNDLDSFDVVEELLSQKIRTV